MDTEIATETDEPKAGDLLYGVPAIADFLGVDEGQARTQHEAGRLPTWKLGQIVCSRRSTLWRWLAEREAVHV